MLTKLKTHRRFKMHTERIEGSDSMLDVIVKMVEGNPGATNVLAQVIEATPMIDPDNAFGGLGVMMSLDTYGIYGSDIYVLFNDKCDSDIRKFLMILRATQMGFCNHVKLAEIAHDQMRSINFTEEEFESFDAQLCKALPSFAKQ